MPVPQSDYDGSTSGTDWPPLFALFKMISRTVCTLQDPQPYYLHYLWPDVLSALFALVNAWSLHC